MARPHDIGAATIGASRRVATHGSLGVRTWLAVFVAQGLWGLVTILAVIGVVTVSYDTSQVADSGGIIDWLVDGADDLAGTSTTVLKAVLAALATVGAFVLIGSLVVPLLIRIFVRVVCGARVSYGWAMVANLASSVFLVALTLLLWFVPGGQPIAAFACWLGSSLLTAMLVQLRLRPVDRGMAAAATDLSATTTNHEVEAQ